ncbi:MAG: pseudouridine-5'-phosphate glycosidase [Egibacteraceae bacterium]
MRVHVAEEVAGALDEGRAVVALDTGLVPTGLPRPRNRVLAEQAESAVRAAGAVPATIAVIDGLARVGLGATDLARLADGGQVLAVRDLPFAVADGVTGGASVGAAAHLAAQVGVPVLAATGFGGVRRDARESWDESADLVALARARVTVVAGGVLPTMDPRATLERLESLGIAVAGVGIDRMPSSYLGATEVALPRSLADVGEAARVALAARGLGLPPSALLLLVGVPDDDAVPARLHVRLVRSATAAAARHEISGSDLTPFLCRHLHQASQGRSLQAHAALSAHAAATAGALARALLAAPPG